MLSKRWLAVIHVGRRQCGNCKNFDLDEGQRAMDVSPAWRAASRIIPPDIMARPVLQKTLEEQRRAHEAEALQIDLQSSDPEVVAAAEKALAARATEPETPKAKSDPPRPKGTPRQRWEDFGACSEHNTLRWMYDTCEKWS